MKSLKTLQRLREKAVARLTEINAQIDLLRGQTLVTCENARCGAPHEIRELVYLQTHWYEKPHGCMGGDCWHPDEGLWQCPRCGRVMHLRNAPDTVALKWHFKEVKDVYSDNS